MEKRIRSVEINDAKAVRDIYAPFVTDNAVSFELDAPDDRVMSQRIRELTAQYPWLVFEADGKVLGYAYASSHRTRQAYQWCVEVSVYVDPSAHHRGVGRALYQALFEVLRRQGYVNAYAGITLPNPASVGLHESLGFTLVGIYRRAGFKFGQWHDVSWLERRLQEAPVPVPNPLPAKDFLSNSHLAAIFEREAQSVKYTSTSGPGRPSAAYR